MTADQLTEKLKSLNACDLAMEWQQGKSLEQVWTTCHRGDWMLWLYQKVCTDKRILYLIAGHCANTVRHLMKDERSIAGVDAAIAYGEGRIDSDQLRTAAYDAAAYAAYAAATATAAADAAYAAYAAYTAYAAYAARQQNQLATADIVRKFVSLETITKLLTA